MELQLACATFRIANHEHHITKPISLPGYTFI
jgi:hypothetical protein